MNNEAKLTGWIRYRICDRSGIGANTNHWIFKPAWQFLDPAEIKDLIIHHYEDWALHADSYSFEYEVGYLPPYEVIQIEIKNTITKIENLTKTLAICVNQLNSK